MDDTQFKALIEVAANWQKQPTGVYPWEAKKQEKDADGKWIIFDGRHRLAAWRAAGYKQLPVVFLKE